MCCLKRSFSLSKDPYGGQQPRHTAQSSRASEPSRPSELMNFAEWKRIVYTQGTPFPSLTYEFAHLGPVKVHRRFEMILHDCVFARLDFFGMLEMYILPKRHRSYTSKVTLDVIFVTGTPFAHDF